jgi:hypothetical protein
VRPSYRTPPASERTGSSACRGHGSGPDTASTTRQGSRPDCSVPVHRVARRPTCPPPGGAIRLRRRRFVRHADRALSGRSPRYDPGRRSTVRRQDSSAHPQMDRGTYVTQASPSPAQDVRPTHGLARRNVWGGHTKPLSQEEIARRKDGARGPKKPSAATDQPRRCSCRPLRRVSARSSTSHECEESLRRPSM